MVKYQSLTQTDAYPEDLLLHVLEASINHPLSMAMGNINLLPKPNAGLIQ